MTPRTRVLLVALVAAALSLPAFPASAEDPAPSVTLTADRAVYQAGQTARLTSTIVAHNLDWQVSIQYPGNSTWIQWCVSFDVNDEVRSCTLGLEYNVKVRAVLIDDKGTASTADDAVVASSAVRSIGVKASLSIAPMGYYTKSGGYAVYPKRAKPSFRSYSNPAFPGKRCLRHRVQRHYASGWRNVLTSACKKEGSQGRVDWKWTGKHPAGVKFRVLTVFPGDAANKPNVGPAFYVRFR